MHTHCVFFIVSFISLVFVPSVWAKRSITIAPAAGFPDSEGVYSVSASPSGFLDDETVYMKGVFYKEGSSNYFGFTRFGDAWIKNSAKTEEQKKVTMHEWDGMISVKPDYTDTGFSGSGEYVLKTGFYYHTEKGTLSSVQWSENSIQTLLIAPTSTPTPEPTPTLSPAVSTKTPTATQKSPTHPPSRTDVSAPGEPAVLSFRSESPPLITGATTPGTKRTVFLNPVGIRELTLDGASSAVEASNTALTDRTKPIQFLLLGVSFISSLAACGIVVRNEYCRNFR